MAPATQADLAAQMVAQLRVLDPNISAEVGTPERKIIDTVAQALADAQIDLNVLSGQFDIQSKFGANLDSFISLFGFARLQSTFATGFATFSRVTASTIDILVAQGTQVMVPGSGGSSNVIFATQADVTLVAGTTSVSAPIQSLIQGSFGNTPASTITTFAGDAVIGVSGVTNTTATTGGTDNETDDALKVRFQQTLFRNMAGTPDQYLALAVAGAFTTKANVVGPISRYREFVQIPPVDDASSYADGSYGTGNGTAGFYTTAMSSIPISQHIWDTMPVFAANGTDATSTFWRSGVDFTFNTTGSRKYVGDTYRFAQAGLDVNPVTDAPVTIISGVTYTDATYRPNFTFMNVYTGADVTVIAPRPGDIVIVDHAYMSSASRNSFTRNIYNAVDVFLDGINAVYSTCNIPKATSVFTFTNNTTSLTYTENFRRAGRPRHRPVAGNILTPLFNQPVLDLPPQIQVIDSVAGQVTYTYGIHYWPVEESTTGMRGTIRARSGIEWVVDAKGQKTGDVIPTLGTVVDNWNTYFTGPTILQNNGPSMVVDQYTYNRNVGDLQVALEGSKQVTTDILAHQAVSRYFKLNLTVIYSSGVTQASVNTNISQAISDFFSRQGFGAVIQLSDLLQTVFDIPGVDSARWTRDDVKEQSTLNRVVECDAFGVPVLNLINDRITTGVTSTTSEAQNLYITGSPTGGTWTLKWQTGSVQTLNYNATTAQVQSAVIASGANAATAVTGSGSPQDPWIITYPNSVGGQKLLTLDPSLLQGGTAAFNSDFFLQDNELPTIPQEALTSDTAPGVVISVRAENTFGRR